MPDDDSGPDFPPPKATSSLQARALSTAEVPREFAVIGFAAASQTEFAIKPVRAGSYYRVRVCAFNVAGSGAFGASFHPPAKVPTRREYIKILAERQAAAEKEDEAD